MDQILVPPFTRDTAIAKVRKAEDGWNTRTPEQVTSAYTVNSHWRNRAEFVAGGEAIISFLHRKWSRELEYRLIKELWSFGDNRIAVRFAYERHDDSGLWCRSFGNENWEFDEHGLMHHRHASINDLPITEPERLFPLAARPQAGRSSVPFRSRTMRVEAGLRIRYQGADESQKRGSTGRLLRLQSRPKTASLNPVLVRILIYGIT